MKVEERFEVQADIEHVFADLNDVGSIGYCIAGVKEVTVQSPTESTWKLEQRFGFMARTFTLAAKITSRESPQHISFGATGQDVSLEGRVNLSAVSPTVTACEIDINIDVTGPLAPLVEVFAKGPQQALIRETLQNIRTKVEGGVIEPPAEPPAKTGVLARFAAWWRRSILRRD